MKSAVVFLVIVLAGCSGSQPSQSIQEKPAPRWELRYNLVSHEYVLYDHVRWKTRWGETIDEKYDLQSLHQADSVISVRQREEYQLQVEKKRAEEIARSWISVNDSLKVRY